MIPDIFKEGCHQLLAEPISKQHFLEDKGTSSHGAGHKYNHISCHGNLGSVDLQELFSGVTQLHAVMMNHLHNGHRTEILGSSII